MGRLPPRPKPPLGNGIFVDNYGITAGEVLTNRDYIIATAVILFIVWLIAVFLWAGSNNFFLEEDPLFYHVVCYDDGRKTFDETLQRLRGFDENRFVRPGSELEIHLPLESCILEGVSEPRGFGR